MVRSARTTTGRSTILPLSEITPEPLAWAYRMAATTARALVISFSVGVNTLFTTSI